MEDGDPLYKGRGEISNPSIAISIREILPLLPPPAFKHFSNGATLFSLAEFSAVGISLLIPFSIGEERRRVLPTFNDF